MAKQPQDVIRRHPGNPVLSPGDLPYPSTLVFNAGVTKYQGRYVMVFRNDHGVSEAEFRARPQPFQTSLGIATSADGVHWQPAARPWLELATDEIRRIYDPRLTVIDGRCHMCFAADTHHGVCGGILVTDDFDRYEILTMTTPDNRNLVLFPERVGGRYLRLERPFPEYSRGYQERFDLWASASPDLRHWGDATLVLAVEDVPFANAKIGPGAPPVKTPRGWLTTFHAVRKTERPLDTWEQAWHKEYLGGLMLLDLAEPTRILGLCPLPILESAADYEVNGFRGSVIFPGGMVLEDSGEVKIYYGAADTVEALATAHVDDLVALCRQPVARGARSAART